MSLNLKAYWVPKILFFLVGCRKPKKIGKHWFIVSKLGVI